MPDMYLDKLGVLWHDRNDAKLSGNGHERILAVPNGPVVFASLDPTHYI